MEGVGMYIKAVIAAVGGGIIYWLGGVDESLKWLMGAIALDYATGLAAAYFKGVLSSEKGFKGIVKKVMMLGVVALAFIIQQVAGDMVPLREITITFFIVNEGISILENASSMGAPIPPALIQKLEQLKGDKKDGN